MTDEPDFTQDLSDEQAIAALGSEYSHADDVEATAAHLEGSINGGDLDIVRSLAMRLLSQLETVALVNARED